MRTPDPAGSNPPLHGKRSEEMLKIHNPTHSDTEGAEPEGASQRTEAQRLLQEALSSWKEAQEVLQEVKELQSQTLRRQRRRTYEKMSLEVKRSVGGANTSEEREEEVASSWKQEEVEMSEVEAQDEEVKTPEADEEVENSECESQDEEVRRSSAQEEQVKLSGGGAKKEDPTLSAEEEQEES